MKHLTLVVPVLVLVLSSLGALPARAQTPEILLKEGDPFLGGGVVESIDYAAIGDSGAWLSLIDNFDPDRNRDGFLIRSGFPVLREGMSLPQPAGATLDDWGPLDVAPNGDLGMGLAIRVNSIATQGLYWNLVQIAQVGTPFDFPPFSANAYFQGVTAVRLTDGRQLVALVKVFDPAIDNVRAVDAVIRFRLDPQGNVIERTTLGTHGMFNAALGATIQTLGSLGQPEQSLALNRFGDFVIPVVGVGRRAILRNMDTLVAAGLTPSPVAGRTWDTNAFSLSRVAINDPGDLVFTGTLTPIGGDPLEPTNYLIVKNDQAVAQSGDVLPALSPAPLAKGTPKVALSNRGNVFWRAQPLSSAFGGAAFMMDHTPLIQEGVTVVDGHTINRVAGDDDCFAISPEGRFFLGRVELQNFDEAVVFLDFGLIRELEGCLGLNQGTLRHAGGAARVGQQFRVAMDGGPAPGADALLLLSSRTSLTASGCGQFTARGELMLTQPIRNVLVLPPWDGANPSELVLSVPNTLALIDATFYLQGLFGIPGRLRSYRLTNALELQIGPP